MLEHIEEIELSFLQAAYGCSEKRKELTKLGGEFRESFRSIAETWEWERESCTAPRRSSSSSSWNLFRRLRDNNIRHNKSKESDSGVENPETKSPNPNNFISKTSSHFSEDERKPEDMNRVEDGTFNYWHDCVEEHINNGEDSLRNQMRRVVDENMRQQAELIKRNEEKRVAIKELNLDLQKMADENPMFKILLELSEKQIRLTRTDSLFSVKLWP